MRRRFLLPLLLALFFITAYAGAHPGSTKIILVRHAEKAEGKNPMLLPEGVLRAQALAQLSKSFDISAIYSTPFHRTQKTADPLAKALNLNVDLSIKPMDYKTQLADIKKKHLGKTVVIVGHSNTVPEFINHVIPQSNLPFISESDFSQIFILTIPRSGSPKLERHTYRALPNGQLSLTPKI